MPASLASATAFCTEYLWELTRRPDIIGHRHRMTAHTDQWLWCTSMVLLLAAWLELPCTAGQKAVENHAFWCRNYPETAQKRPAVTVVTPAPAAAKIFALVHRGENVDIFFHFCAKFFYCGNALYCSSSS